MLGNQSVNCLNCNTSLSEDAKYCSSCGQSRKETKLSIWQIIGDAFVNFFNIDNRIFHTLKDIFQTSKLTSTYVAGKRKYYVNPIRIFILAVIILISLAIYTVSEDTNFSIADAYKKEIAIAKHKQLWDSVMVSYKNDQNDSLLNALEDTLYHDVHIDSLVVNQNSGSAFGVNLRDYNFKMVDVVNLNSSELIEKYKVEGFKEKMVVKQYHRFVTDTSGGIKYAIKNLSWIILILMFVMAAALKIMHIRGKYFYVEHLVLLLYRWSFIFVMSIIVLIILNLSNSDSFLSSLIGPTIATYYITEYLSFKKYYQQGWIKTFIKQVLFNAIFLIAAIVIVALGAVISLILF